MSANTSAKTITFISRSTPYGGGLAKACLDMVLSAAVFEQKINLVFMDDGVWQLKSDQAPQQINAKGLSAALSALPLYEVSNVFVESESLALRGLNLDALSVDVTPYSAAAIATLLRESDVVFQL